MWSLRTFLLIVVCFSVPLACTRESGRSDVDAIVAPAHLGNVLFLSVSKGAEGLEYSLSGDAITRDGLVSRLTEISEFDNATQIQILPGAEVSEDVLEEVSDLIEEAGLRVWKSKTAQ